jgi:hypothetical protein
MLINGTRQPCVPFATGVVKRHGDLGLIGHRDLEGVVVDLFRAVFAELP